MGREPKLEMVTTTVRIRREVWLMLRALSETRAAEVGGRPSVSATIAALAEKAHEAAPRG